MSIIIALIIGGVIGWLAAAVVGRREGIIASIVIGIVGAIIGGLLAGLFGSSQQSYLSFSWAGLIWSFIGAVIFAALLNSLQHRSTRSHV